MPRHVQIAALLLACLAGGAAAQQISTVTDLKQRIYTTMPLGRGAAGDACVRLLTADGEVGCAAPPGGQPTEGRMLRLEALQAPEEYPDAAVYVVPPSLLADFLAQCQASPALAARVRGVLAEPEPAPAYSQAAAAPLAGFALYANSSYEWNPTGRGLIEQAFPFPIFLLDNATAEDARQRAAYNAEQQLNGALHHARMHLTMEAAGNSSACIAARACLPVGGNTVVAALPPLPAAAGNGSAGSADDGMPALWLLAQFDTAALFHEAAAGADAPVSGLIALLAAAEVLGSADAAAVAGRRGQRYRRRLVFAALAGEPWGLMGSKRLLWEAAAGGNASAAAAPALGLAPGRVAGVLEISQVGRSRQPGGSDRTRLYTHTPAGGAAPAADLLAALQAAAAASGDAGGVAVAPAGAAAPGLPPTASAGSLVRVLGGGGGNATLPAVLLSGFDTAFSGATFHTQYDTLDTVDADSIAAAAVVLARAAHALALGGPPGEAAAAAAALPVNYTAVKGSVEGLLQCLLNATVGLNCPLARGVMTPVNLGALSHYVGIVRTLTADPQLPDPNLKSDFERFLWNWLAFALDPPPANSSSSSGGGAGSSASGAGGATDGNGGGSGGGSQAYFVGLQRCQPMNATACPPGHVCAGSRSIKGPDGQGYCLNASVLYVPAYSTSLACDGCDGANTNYENRWQLTDAAVQWEQQHGWPADPIWTESNWPSSTPALTLYLKEAPGVENALLAAGLGVAAASVLAAAGLHLAYNRKLKQQ